MGLALRAVSAAVLAVLLPAVPTPGARTSPLDGVRESVVLKGLQIGLGEEPSTRQKRILWLALARLDRPRASRLDDLRAAVPVFRMLDAAFPGDPALGPAIDAALDAFRQEIHGEQQMLLGWTGRTRTDRDRRRLQRGVRRLNGFEDRFYGEDGRARRARLLLDACLTVDRTRRGIRLVLPSMDPPRFEGRAPDFSLADENPASATAGRAVSPRDYLGNVTAVFFMAST